MYLEFRCTPYTTGGECMVRMPQRAVCITESSRRFTITVLDDGLLYMETICIPLSKRICKQIIIEASRVSTVKLKMNEIEA